MVLNDYQSYESLYLHGTLQKNAMLNAISNNTVHKVIIKYVICALECKLTHQNKSTSLKRDKKCTLKYTLK